MILECLSDRQWPLEFILRFKGKLALWATVPFTSVVQRCQWSAGHTLSNKSLDWKDLEQIEWDLNVIIYFLKLLNTSSIIYNATCCEFGVKIGKLILRFIHRHRGNFLQHNKGHIWQTHSQHRPQWWKTETISTKIRNKTRLPTLNTIIQHSFGSFSHSN